VLLVPRVAVLRRLMRAPASAAAALWPASASSPHGPLKPRARRLGDTRARRRLPFAGLSRVHGLGAVVELFVTLGVLLRVFFFVALFMRLAVIAFAFVHLTVLFFVRFQMLAFVSLSVRFAVFRGRLRCHGLVVHFVGDGVGFFGGFLVLVLVGVQSFLQLLEFGRFNVRFGDRFDRFGALFRVGLRFFVLGFSQLLGERGNVFVGQA
jgi:hypothetical protein